jgi:threonine dehydrogenase-like Zn-dependent dehydrogenase
VPFTVACGHCEFCKKRYGQLATIRIRTLT